MQNNNDMGQKYTKTNKKDKNIVIIKYSTNDKNFRVNTEGSSSNSMTFPS